MRIVLFNVKYSPNLGDGVIAECLERELERRFRDATVLSLDLAGRTGWAPPDGGRARAARLELLRRMPDICRDAAVAIVLGVRLWSQLRLGWRTALGNADLAVFGGGQLIQDGDLNFPLKLNVAANECRRRGVPFAVYGVGAAPSRSARGRRLLLPVLDAARSVHLEARDEPSARALSDLVGGDVDIGRDPGLLAARIWRAPPPPRRARPVVGLGITHPAVLRYHGKTAEPTAGGRAAMLDLYDRLVGELVAAGYDVVLFSNGAAEDEELLAALVELLWQGDLPRERVRIQPRARSPEDLARLIASLDAVLAHRLHACILAYSYRVPHIGFTWDGKLADFFTSVQRTDYALPLSAESLPTIVPLLARARAEGIPGEAHARILAEAGAGIDRLAAALAEADARKSARQAPVPALRVQGASQWS